MLGGLPIAAHLALFVRQCPDSIDRVKIGFATLREVVDGVSAGLGAGRMRLEPWLDAVCDELAGVVLWLVRWLASQGCSCTRVVLEGLSSVAHAVPLELLVRMSDRDGCMPPALEASVAHECLLLAIIQNRVRDAEVIGQIYRGKD